MNDYRPFRARRVLLITEDMTFDGTLIDTGKQTLTLDKAVAVSEGERRTPIDGQVVVPVATVIWAQVP